MWYQYKGTKDEGKCCLCDVILVKKAKRGDAGEWHIEHVWGVVHGGPDLYPNLIPLCHACNLKMKRGCVSTFHHLANEGYISQSKADEEIERHKAKLTAFDPRCTAFTDSGTRCLNHKCGKDETWCYQHVKVNIQTKIGKQ